MKVDHNCVNGQKQIRTSFVMYVYGRIKIDAQQTGENRYTKQHFLNPTRVVSFYAGGMSMQSLNPPLHIIEKFKAGKTNLE